MASLAFGIDLFAHKHDEKILLKQAGIWSIFWIGVSVLFGIYLYFERGSEIASLYFAGYALEKSLSVDNLFVMMAIFSWFNIPEIYRHRVLYFGVIGAMIFRLIFVAVGTMLFAISPWTELIFAAIVAYSAVMMIKKDKCDEDIKDYSNHIAIGQFTTSFRFYHSFLDIVFLLNLAKFLSKFQIVKKLLLTIKF